MPLSPRLGQTNEECAARGLLRINHASEPKTWANKRRMCRPGFVEPYGVPQISSPFKFQQNLDGYAIYKSRWMNQN